MHLLIKAIKNQQSGIAMILSMVILMAIFGLVIVVADVAFDIRASNKAIGLSEKALFASESVTEWTIYEIEKDPSSALSAFVPNPVFNQVINLTPGDVAYWDRNVTAFINTPGLCGADIPKPVCTINNEPVSNTNDLFITLKPGQSFQLDLDIVGAAYPNNININITGVNSEIIILDRLGVIIIDTGNVKIPQIGNIGNTLGLKFRLINRTNIPPLTPLTQEYKLTVTPGDLPLGFDIDVTGRYLGTERQIRLTRPAWLIY